MKFGDFDNSDDRNNDKKSRRPVNIDTSGYAPGMTPNAPMGRASGSNEMTLAKAQEYVNTHAPYTVQAPTRQQVEAMDRVRAEAATLKGPAAVEPRREAPMSEQAFRDNLAYEQGRLESLQGAERVPSDVRFMDPQNDREQAFLQKGYDDMNGHLMAEYMAMRDAERAAEKDHNFRAAETIDKVELVTDKLKEEGQTERVTTHTADGQTKTHSYQLDGDRVAHTAPNGAVQSMTLAEAKVFEANRAAHVNQNTMQAVQRMKSDPTYSVKSGDYTYSVEGTALVRQGADGKKTHMPLDHVENRLANRQEQLQKLQTNAQRDLRADNKERKDIKNTLEKRAERGDNSPVVTYDHKRQPTTWKLENGGLVSSKGRSPDAIPTKNEAILSAAHQRFAQRLEASRTARDAAKIEQKPKEPEPTHTR